MGNPVINGVEQLTTHLQPNITQFQNQINGPLVHGIVFETMKDCLKYHEINKNYTYPHKRIWIKSEEVEYFLNSGNGTQEHNWKRVTARLISSPWNSDKPYSKNDIVMVSGKIYCAKHDILSNQKSPIENEHDWQVITGEIETYQYKFSGVNSVLVYTEIRNPIFEIYKAEPKIVNGEHVLNSETNLPEYINKEKIDAFVEQVETEQIKDGEYLANSEGGVPYRISFFENELPVKLTGFVVVK